MQTNRLCMHERVQHTNLQKSGKGGMLPSHLLNGKLGIHKVAGELGVHVHNRATAELEGCNKGMSTAHQQQHRLATHMAHKKVPNSFKFLPAISPLTQLRDKVLMQVANLWDLVEYVTDRLCLQDSSLMPLKRLHVHL